MADQRIQYTEELVGAGHGSKSDTLNRLALIEHNNDGTHKSPKFSAHRNGTDQTGIATATWTKLELTTESFDTDNCFDSTTNYRFTPTVAGYYFLEAQVMWVVVPSSVSYWVAIYKNGSAVKKASVIGSMTTDVHVSTRDILYANGSSDYFEVYVYQATGLSKDINGASANTSFIGTRVM